MSVHHARLVALGGVALLAGGAALASMPASAQAAGRNGTTLTATTTLDLSAERVATWSITKTVTPALLDLRPGQTGTGTFEVAVAKSVGATKGTASGQVCITNGGAVPTEGLTVRVDLFRPPSKTSFQGAVVKTSSNPVLDPYETGCYDFEMVIAASELQLGSTYKATSTITIDNHSGHLGEAFGPAPSASATMPDEPTEVGGSVTVRDSDGKQWSTSESHSWSYATTLGCADAGTYRNVATITQTGAKATAEIVVSCTPSSPPVTSPPVTSPPVTSPPVTTPPVTTPPVTTPPVTTPPVTTPPVTTPPVTTPPVTTPPATTPPATTPPATTSPSVTSPAEEEGSVMGETYVNPNYLSSTQTTTTTGGQTLATTGGSERALTAVGLGLLAMGMVLIGAGRRTRTED